jgi:hypothetical protein
MTWAPGPIGGVPARWSGPAAVPDAVLEVRMNPDSCGLAGRGLMGGRFRPSAVPSRVSGRGVLDALRGASTRTRQPSAIWE